MSNQPLITFKAGKCSGDYSSRPPRITPLQTPGYLYLYSEDDLIHFCWRARDASLSSPDLDLVMPPTDGTFRPYTGPTKPSADAPNKSPLNGRVFVLKFLSSSQRYFFWLQSREQPAGDPSRFSQRDLKLGEIVDNLLQGGDMEEGDIAELRQQGGDGPNDGGGESMDGVQPSGPTTDGAGSNAQADGPGDGGQAGGSRSGGGEGRSHSSNTTTSSSTNAQIANLLASLNPNNQQQQQQQQLQALHQPSTTLPDLLQPSTTVPLLSTLPITTIDTLLLHHLPPQLLTIARNEAQADNPTASLNLSESTSNDHPSTLIASLSDEKKRDIVARVLRSPQFVQALSGITSAIRDGGLPSVAEALGVGELEGGGYWDREKGLSREGGHAMETFLDGLKRTAEKENMNGKSAGGESKRDGR